jgi:hypothetical protein
LFKLDSFHTGRQVAFCGCPRTAVNLRPYNARFKFNDSGKDLLKAVHLTCGGVVSLKGRERLTVPLMYDISQLPYTVYGNDMLTGLSDGTHNLTIYGETFIGGLNGYFNETVSFRVDTSNAPTLAPFPASIVFVTSVGIALSI